MKPGASKHELQSSCFIHQAMIPYINCSKNFDRLGNTALLGVSAFLSGLIENSCMMFFFIEITLNLEPSMLVLILNDSYAQVYIILKC